MLNKSFRIIYTHKDSVAFSHGYKRAVAKLNGEIIIYCVSAAVAVNWINTALDSWKRRG